MADHQTEQREKQALSTGTIGNTNRPPGESIRVRQHAIDHAPFQPPSIGSWSIRSFLGLQEVGGDVREMGVPKKTHVRCVDPRAPDFLCKQRRNGGPMATTVPPGQNRTNTTTTVASVDEGEG